MKPVCLPLKTAARLVCLALLFALSAPSSAVAGDLKMDVQLIWGTNDEKSPNPNHKPVDEALDKKLKKIFKWKKYFAVKHEVVPVPNRQMRKVVLSKKCSIEIVELEGPKIEVRLFGEGKLLNKTIASTEDIITLAGEDKAETAWFVILQQINK